MTFKDLLADLFCFRLWRHLTYLCSCLSIMLSKWEVIRFIQRDFVLSIDVTELRMYDVELAIFCHQDSIWWESIKEMVGWKCRPRYIPCWFICTSCIWYFFCSKLFSSFVYMEKFVGRTDFGTIFLMKFIERNLWPAQ